ncbi:MAG: A24 family peptidase [Rubricella sp.]
MAIHLVLVAAPMLYATYTDLKDMRIPNIASLILIGIFVVTAPFLFGWSEIGMRLGIAFGVLVITFILNAMGHIGGGDAKLFAAAALFIPPELEGWFPFLLIVGITGVVALLVHRRAQASVYVQARAGHWRSFTEKKHFPYGIAISLGLILYLALSLIGRI